MVDFPGILPASEMLSLVMAGNLTPLGSLALVGGICTGSLPAL